MISNLAQQMMHIRKQTPFLSAIESEIFMSQYQATVNESSNAEERGSRHVVCWHLSLDRHCNEDPKARTSSFLLLSHRSDLETQDT